MIILERWRSDETKLKTNLSWTQVERPLWVRREALPQAEEFTDLEVLFTSGGETEQELDRQICAASSLVQTLDRSVTVERERAEPKGQTLCSLVDLCCYAHPQIRTEVVTIAHQPTGPLDCPLETGREVTSSGRRP